MKLIPSRTHTHTHTYTHINTHIYTHRQIYTHRYTHIYPSVSSFQSLSCVQLFGTPWIAARQASLSITNSRSLLKLMSIELVMPSSHLILCRPLLLLPPVPLSIRVFSNESQLFAWGGQSTGVSASASVLPVNTQDWSSSGWTGWISLQAKGLSSYLHFCHLRHLCFCPRLLWFWCRTLLPHHPRDSNKVFQKSISPASALSSRLSLLWSLPL